MAQQKRFAMRARGHEKKPMQKKLVSTRPVVDNHSHLHLPARRQNRSMYVCICNAVTDREIRLCAELGARSIDDLRENLGVATCCGQCADAAERVLHEHCEATADVLQAA